MLVKHCFACHGPSKQKGGLRFDRRSAALKGGDSGPAIVPGQGAESLIVQLTSGEEADRVMPPKGERLTRPAARDAARLDRPGGKLAGNGRQTTPATGGRCGR